MAVAGSLTYDAKINKKGFEKGLDSLKKTTNTIGGQIKSIVAGLGIDRLISASFNLINNSVDGAISRLDTLNNYPKVMSNLGIATDKSQKSIEKMSDKLSGLPTTLDEGALAVQRFTSANSDIEKSTDYFLALNNALLAGGAGADIQSTAMEQLSQAYAKGKPDMMEWRSIQTAMPAQLNQVAKAFNMTSDELGEALRNGKVSMDDFMKMIVKLNTEGTGDFQSFEDQAKNSTGGIATSITVAKTQIVKGVADIISSLNEILQNRGLGSIGDIISNIGKKAKEVLDVVAQKLPKIINTLSKLTPIIAGVVSALIAYKTVLIAINVINFVSGIMGTVKAFILLLPAIKSAKDAMLLFNMVTSLNPIGLIIAAIVALIAIFAVLWVKCEGFRNFWIGLWEGIKNVISKAIDFIKNNWKSILLFLVNPFAGAFKLLYDNCEGFRNFINNLIENIKQFFINAWNGIVTFFTEGIPNFIQSVIQWFQDLPYKIGYLIGTILGHIVQFGQNVWNWITVELPNIIQGIIDWFAQLPNRIWEWLLKVIENIKNWCVDTYNTASQWISNTINSIVEWFKQLPRKNMDLVTKYNK